MSSRAKRRQAARKESRTEDLREKEAFYRATNPEAYFKAKTKVVDNLSRNGITPADLEKEYDRGFNDGFKRAADPIVKGCFAAVCLALSDLHGFGRKRCMDVLNAMDGHLTMTLTSADAIESVYRRMGLVIEFREPFDRVREV